MFGLCGKDKSDTLFSLINLTCSWDKGKNIYVHIYTSANNRILIPENGKQF